MNYRRNIVAKLRQPHFSHHMPRSLPAKQKSFPGLVLRLSEPVVPATVLGSMGLASRVCASAEVSGGGAGLGEVAREDGLDERAEDDLGAAAGCELSHT